MTGHTWHPYRKSTYSNGTSGCVEVAWRTDRAAVRVRDTKQHGRGPVLEFEASEWLAFVTGCVAGEFDDLA